MRPVDLSPRDSPIVSAPGGGGGGSRSTVGLVVVAIIAVLGVGGYFAMGRVDTLKERAASLQAESQQFTQETATITAQIAEAGQTQGTDYATIASNKEQQLEDALGERIDYPLFERELAEVQPVGGWFTSVVADVSNDNASTGLDAEPTTGTGTLELDGYVRSTTDLAALIQRINSARTMQDAKPGATTWVTSNTGARFLRFEITGRLQVSKDATDNAAADPTSLVGGPAGDSADTGSVSLDPRPGYGKDAEGTDAAKATRQAKAEEPPSALELAATAANGGAK